MLNENYEDPDETTILKIVEDFKQLTTHEEIYSLINSIFPNWIIYVSDRYSTDYPHLEKNWEVICQKTNCEKQKIVMVDKIFNPDPQKNHNLLNFFCEVMSVSGYIVRRQEEFTVCTACNASIPSEKLFNVMKEKKVPLNLDVWSNICSECQQ